MIGRFVIPALLIAGLAAAYAISCWLVGRTDKAHTCGTDSCEHCAMNTESCKAKTEKP